MNDNTTEIRNSDRNWRGKFVWPPVIVIATMHILAAYSLLFYSWKNFFGFLVAHFLIGGLGAVIGLHRYFSHKSFTCPTWFENLLGFLATLNMQNGPIKWAMYHRAHHRFSDGPGDPHSSSRGFLWSHLVWMFYICPNGFRKNAVSVKDLTSSRFLSFLDENQLLINAVTMLTFLLLTQNLGLFLWVFPLRIVAVWHSTWLINSYTHEAEFNPTQKPRNIKNSWLMSALMYGDGWHLNHHKYPSRITVTDTSHSFDPAFLILKLLHRLKIVHIPEKFL